MCDRLIRISTQDGCDARLQEYFYLLFLPLIWIASRNGLSGARWARAWFRLAWW